MGSPKTQTVGGGAATPVANSWNQFLQGQLYQTPGAQAIPQTMANAVMPPRPRGMPDAVWDRIQSGFSNMNAARSGQGATSMPGPFQNALSSLMNPNAAATIAGNPWLSQMSGFNPSANLPSTPNLPNLVMPGQPNMPGAPSWVPTNFQTPNTVNANPINFQQVSAATSDPFSILSRVGSSKDLLSSFGINPTPVGTGGSSGIPGFSPGSLRDPSSDPSFQAIQQIAERQKASDIANIRARYGSTGNTASSGASLAESQYLAEANPRLIASLGELGRGIQGLDLQQQGINNQQQLGLAGLGVQDALGRLGIGTNANTANIGNLLQYIQGTRGQDINTATNILGQNLQNLQTTSGQNAGNSLTASIQDAINNINAGNINASNTMGMNQLLGNQGIAQNNFLSNLFGQQSNNALNLFGQNSSNALNAYNAQVNPLLQLFGMESNNALANQGNVNNWMSNLLSGGLNLQNMLQGGQIAGINNLFNSFNQANQLGTPQAQTVQTPSPFSQIMGLASTFAPLFPGMQPFAAANIASGMGGGGGGMPSLPSLSPNPTPNFGIGQPNFGFSNGQGFGTGQGFMGPTPSFGIGNDSSLLNNPALINIRRS